MYFRDTLKYTRAHFYKSRSKSIFFILVSHLSHAPKQSTVSEKSLFSLSSLGQALTFHLWTEKLPFPKGGKICQYLFPSALWEVTPWRTWKEGQLLDHDSHQSKSLLMFWGQHISGYCSCHCLFQSCIYSPHLQLGISFPSAAPNEYQHNN